MMNFQMINKPHMNSKVMEEAKKGKILILKRVILQPLKYRGLEDWSPSVNQSQWNRKMFYLQKKVENWVNQDFLKILLWHQETVICLKQGMTMPLSLQLHSVTEITFKYTQVVYHSPSNSITSIRQPKSRMPNTSWVPQKT